MIRKNLKLLLTIFLIVLMSLSIFSSLIYATDVTTISETVENISVDGESINDSTTEATYICSIQKLLWIK